MNGRDMVGRLAEKAKEVMGKNRLIILAGVILLALPVGGKEEEAKEGCSTPAETFDLAETEARLSQALSKIQGAGEVTVVLTVEHIGRGYQPGQRRRGQEHPDGGDLPRQRPAGGGDGPGGLSPLPGCVPGV